MQTRQVFLVDAFASEPTGGSPTLVVLEDETTSDSQLAALTGEFGTEVAALSIAEDSPERLRLSREFTADTGEGLDRSPDESLAIVAATALARERDRITAGTTTVTTPGGERAVELNGDGCIWTEFKNPTPEQVDVDYDSVGAALGIDSAALRDVGADLPPVRVDAGVDALALPVNFLEHLSGATPDADALSAVASRADVEAICAFTFDTLDAEAACHARTFVPNSGAWPRAIGYELPVTPRIVAGALTHVVDRGTIDDATPTVEQGQFAGRPGQVHVRTGAMQVGGRAVTTLDGTVTLPESEDGDIIEA